jgi:hypothetical protein
MKNIHVLPTDKPSRLVGNDVNQLCYQSNKSYKNDRKWMHRKKFNIYITSDEEIKEGDWYLVELFKITGESDGFHIEKCTKLDDVWCNNFDVISTRHKDNCKKIILTTDQNLIKDGVQAIDDEFLEWFIKNPKCEEVKVEVDLSKHNGQFQTKYGWKIIIPQEKAKQETLENELWGNVFAKIKQYGLNYEVLTVLKQNFNISKR